MSSTAPQAPSRDRRPQRRPGLWRRLPRGRGARRMAAVAVLAGAGLALLNAVSESDSSFTVTQGDFTLTCPQNTLAEGATLTCTLANTSGDAKPWPVVAIMHRSTDTDRALVVGSRIDVDFGTRSPAADLDNGAWWIGSTLVGYSRFDWDGSASADPAAPTTTTTTTTTTVAGATTTTVAGATSTTTTTTAAVTTTTTAAGGTGHTRTVSIRATDDTRKESREKFYVALGPDGSRGVGFLYNNRHAVTVTDNDTASSDKSLSSLKATAGGEDNTLSTAAGVKTVTVGYQVTEATLTAEAAHDRATMSMTATHSSNSVALGAGGAASVDLISGRQSAAVPLAVGTTVVTLTVTAEDGSTDSHVVNIERSALGTATTVTVSAAGFTLSCPAEVVEGDDVTCTLTNTGSSRAPWPVVAVLHSSADSQRALVSEDPIIPNTDPAYGKDVSLGGQQPARQAFFYGYGELFSGGSLSVYRTYGYEKFDWTGNASGSAKRTVNIELHEETAADDSADSPETFYVAIAPSGYTGLSQLVDNMAPIMLRQQASVTSVSVGSIGQTSATVTASVSDADGSTLYLRHRTGTESWTETSKASAASTVFSLTGLLDGTAYEVEVSFESDFASGVTSKSFTTVPAPEVSSVSVGSIGQTSATVTAAVSDADDSTLYLRHRTGTEAWTETSKASAASTVFSLTGLLDGTAYEVEVSFESDFASGVTSKSFTTVPAPEVSSVSVGSIGQTSASVTVAVSDADDSTLYLRYRTGAASWSLASKASAASTVFSLTGLLDGTAYSVDVSFESDFASGVTSTSFTTVPAPEVSSVSVGSIGQTSASVTVSVSHVDGSTLYLRYRTGTESWTETSKTSTATTAFSLADLSPGTAYSVEVSFESDYGSVTSESFTTVPEPSVSSVSVGSIGQTSASVSVVVADSDGSTLYLRYRTGSDSWTTSSKASTATTVFSLSNLTAGTAYSVDVSFESDFGSGVTSASFTTVAPDASVSSVSVGSIGQTSASVSAVVADSDGSTLYLRYRTGSESWTETSKASTATTVFSLSSLTAGTAYSVDVSFESDFASGVASASFTTVAPDASVSSVSVGSIGQTSAQVSAVVADSDGSTLYLRYRTGSESWTETSKASTATTVFSLSNLTAGTAYSVDVSFESDFASGVTSASFTTGAPDPSVSSVSVGSIGQTSAQVSAVVADSDGSTLYLRYRTGSESWTETSKASTATTVFSLADLTADTAYDVGVSFKSDFATGEIAASFTTGAPDPSVSSVSVGSIGQTSAQVSVVVADSDGSTLYLRYRTGVGSWTVSSKASSATTVFSLANLTAGTAYDVGVSFKSDFASGERAASFTTEAPQVATPTPGGQTNSNDIREIESAVIPGGPGPGGSGPGGPGPGGSGPGGSGPGGSGPAAGREVDEPASGVFADVSSSSVHEASVDALYAAGVTAGCGRRPMRFCPDEPVTRGQMAVFLERALNLAPGPVRAVGFTDVDSSSVYRTSVGALYAARITVGCGRDPLRFCPNEPVTRAQMAMFLVRALDLDPDRARAVGFTDVSSSSVHGPSIDALYAAGITGGCGRDPMRFCPDEPVTRAQMATFLVRGLEL